MTPLRLLLARNGRPCWLLRGLLWALGDDRRPAPPLSPVPAWVPPPVAVEPEPRRCDLCSDPVDPDGFADADLLLCQHHAAALTVAAANLVRSL